jgi:hypothetical protein
MLYDRTSQEVLVWQACCVLPALQVAGLLSCCNRAAVCDVPPVRELTCLPPVIITHVQECYNRNRANVVCVAHGAEQWKSASTLQALPRKLYVAH